MRTGIKPVVTQMEAAKSFGLMGMGRPRLHTCVLLRPCSSRATAGRTRHLLVECFTQRDANARREPCAAALASIQQLA